MPPHVFGAALCAALAVTVSGSRASASQETEPFALSQQRDAAAAEAAPARGHAPFEKGSWSTYVQGMYYFDLEREDTTIGAGAIGVGYYFKDNQSWNFQLAGYDLQQDGQDDKWGGSFDILYRNHFVSRDPWTVFIDGGAGIFWADDPFPAGGTHQNFTLQAGFGVTRRVSDSMHLTGAARWFHVSNARKEGRERNPHTDGIGLFVGLMWTR